MYEIERKFLIKQKLLPKKFNEIQEIKQGYLYKTDKQMLRVRKNNNNYYLTIKIKKEGIKRIEIEKTITKEEFNVLWKEIPENQKIEKTRKILKNSDGTKWEIDFFKNLSGKLKDLILAEIELPNENYNFKIPKWLGKEVSNDPKYLNQNLIKYTTKKIMLKNNIDNKTEVVDDTIYYMNL